MPTLRYYANGAIAPGLDFDDALQEGLIGLFQAIKTYNPQNTAGANFNTYAASCIKNAVINAQRTAGRQKNAPLNHSIPLEDSISLPGPEDVAIEKAAADEVLKAVRNKLSKFERAVFIQYLEGYSYQEIAQSLSKPLKSVDNAMLRARRKLSAN